MQKKVIKFGGKSLASAAGFQNVIEIIQNRTLEGQVYVVVSAIGDATDTLEKILETAKNQQNYVVQFEEFKNCAYHQETDLKEEFDLLQKLFEGVHLLGDYSLKVKDLVLAQGELISSKLVASQLNNKGFKAVSVDSRQFFVTDNQFGNAQILEEKSRTKTIQYFKQFSKESIAVVTGFIAANQSGETTTFGRNGSNYSAALLSDFLSVNELQNFTHVDGIFTANPDWVKEAQKIEEIHFDEANELASIGASILHAKTIQPLLKKEIPLRILNTLNPNQSGTLISSKPTNNGVKSLLIQSDVSLIQLEGKGLLGKVGVDARVFGVLANAGISIGLISQGSSERGLGFVVAEIDAQKAVELLRHEFNTDFYNKDVSSVSVRNDIAVISIIGQDLSSFDSAYAALVKNKIIPILFNNSVNGKSVNLVVKREEAKKAINVIHGQIFGVSKKVNLAIFGHGLVGNALIEQILESKASIEEKKGIKLNVFAIANSKKILLNADGIGESWKEDLVSTSQTYTLQDIIDFANEHHLENLISIDNTADIHFVKKYPHLINNGFDLVSSNKSANTLSYDFYKELRNILKENHKEYLYETNVGAGLPLIDTIKLLHLSGENITKIRGVFSGSLSYIFNTFSIENRSFESVLKEAIQNGFTEPDPRDDLSGKDVARKLLILARELDLKNELSEVKIQNLVPKELSELKTTEFLENLEGLDYFSKLIKKNLGKGKVLRYVGELSGDLQQEKGVLETRLVEVDAQSPLGQLKGSDSLFEIYTESYGDNPIVIQGAGAGAKVTARGVFGDVLRLANR